MPLDAFPSVCPSYSSSGQTRARVLVTNFGDGHNQRVPDGVNNLEHTWNVVWDKLTDTDANTVENFLVGKLGATAFTWTPPGQTTALKWICQTWSRAPSDGSVDRSDMTATFQQVFDL